MNLKERIDAGIDGKFRGLHNGFDKINRYIFGLQRSSYYLIGGLSGTYKSMIVNYMLLNAIEDAKKLGINLKVFYYSFEIDRLSNECNWLSNMIYRSSNVLIPTETIKGLGDNRLNDYQKSIVDSYIPMLESSIANISFTYDPINPTGIYRDLIEYAESVGKTNTIKYIDHDTKTERDKIVSYTPNNSDDYKIVILDHAALLKKESGFETKAVIDKMSEYFVKLRNIYGYTIILIQQFNQGLTKIITVII